MLVMFLLQRFLYSRSIASSLSSRTLGPEAGRKANVYLDVHRVYSDQTPQDKLTDTSTRGLKLDDPWRVDALDREPLFYLSFM